jgi:hypothetical protein
MRPPSTGRSWRSWPAALVVVRGTLRAPMGGFCLPDLGLLASWPPRSLLALADQVETGGILSPRPRSMKTSRP